MSTFYTSSCLGTRIQIHKYNSILQYANFFQNSSISIIVKVLLCSYFYTSLTLKTGSCTMFLFFSLPLPRWRKQDNDPHLNLGRNSSKSLNPTRLVLFILRKMKLKSLSYLEDAQQIMLSVSLIILYLITNSKIDKIYCLFFKKNWVQIFIQLYFFFFYQIIPNKNYTLMYYLVMGIKTHAKRGK
jgi:hypothetical protein